ncbi:MAG: methyltransferase [Cyclobacteriaceae bacterium]|nr:methyltransferase [Cyclobacteriaceae bacterium]
MNPLPAIQQLHASKKRRYELTLAFLAGSVAPPARILDLGTPNPLSERMASLGYQVTNTQGEDLDDTVEALTKIQADCTTAFEIFEHLLNPLGVLRALPTQRLVASVPLSLWFAKAYRNPAEPWDRHFHEFEDWQFDWLLEKGGWKIVRREKWTSPVSAIGLRPILRRFTPRYYIVDAVRL